MIYLPFAVVIALDGPPLGFAAVLGMGLSSVLHTGYFLLLQHGCSIGVMSAGYTVWDAYAVTRRSQVRLSWRLHWRAVLAFA
ncbi:hypothetical protein [Allokutzneria sp. NRRL B-24872]|uniref:hypothetical protein n=1 Tax=Allokutzneria sp. NRRL B-24872 TaxID=1137961 RepID=UPI000A3A24AA|nr:hypothetical protein [Allokutzneria sp. NRRL B-24872]